MIAVIVVIVARAVMTVVRAVMTVARVKNAARVMKTAREPHNGRHQPDPDAPSVPSSSQDLPVLRSERAEDRLQGHQASAALHFRARQDCSVPHHGCQPEEAA